MNYFRCGGGRSTHTATKIAVAKTPLATFSGNVSGLNLAETIAYIVATQSGSGTPSPSNPRAINGVDRVVVHNNGSSINQWDEQWEVGGYNTTTGQKTTASSRIRNANYIAVIPSIEYYIYNGGYAYRLFYYDANRNFISSSAYDATSHLRTMPSNCYFINFQSAGNYGSTYNNDISINYPSTDTSYHAYNGTTATTALPTTCYGGYLNLETGVLTRTHWIVDMGDIGYNTTGGDVLYTTKNSIRDATGYDPKRTETADAMCSVDTLSQSTNQIRFDTITTAPADVPTVYAGQKIVYELATPTTEQLTPHQIEQLLQNNVFCSSGDVAVKYWKID